MGDNTESLMDDLAAAWDEAETEEVETEEVSNDAEVQQQDDPDSEGLADDTTGGLEEQSEPEVQPEQLQGNEEGTEPEAVTDDDKPPVGLSATAREAWGETPKAIRDEISKREKEYAAGIQKYAENHKRATQMDQVLGPYQQLFAMNGGAGQTLPGLLQTASVLQMGAPAQKAQMVAQLINQFGVDIKALDNILVGQEPPQEVSQAHNVEQMIDQRMRQFQEQQQQAYLQQQQGHVMSEIEQFAADPKHEFYADVRADMADMMDIAARNGHSLSLQDAYDRCCRLHPEIGQILQSRASKDELAQKKAAAASITGSLGGPGGKEEPDSLRDAIESAWANAGR